MGYKVTTPQAVVDEMALYAERQQRSLARCGVVTL
jgi:hypothetical protein